MGGCKRTSLNRKMAPARKSLATGEAGRRTKLGRGVFQVPLSAAQGQQGGDTPSKDSESDPSSIWTGSSTTKDGTGAGTKMTHRAKPPRSHLNDAISRFLLGCFGLTIPVFPIDETSSNNLRRLQGGKSFLLDSRVRDRPHNFLESPFRFRKQRTEIIQNQLVRLPGSLHGIILDIMDLGCIIKNCSGSLCFITFFGANVERHEKANELE